MRTDRELTPAELDAFGAELDALRERTLADLGAADARYIRRVRAAVRLCCTAGRVLLMFGWFPPTWLLGTLLLGLGKILENMEDWKSTRLNSSHVKNSYAVFCLKKKIEYMDRPFYFLP